MRQALLQAGDLLSPEAEDRSCWPPAARRFSIEYEDVSGYSVPEDTPQTIGVYERLGESDKNQVAVPIIFCICIT